MAVLDNYKNIYHFNIVEISNEILSWRSKEQ